MPRKPVILVPTPFFPPAYKAGGALKSVANLVAALSDRYEFRVHAYDRDIDGAPNGVGDRQAIGGSTVFFHDPPTVGVRSMHGWMDGVDLIYLNGFFERAFSLKVAATRRFHAAARSTPMLIAPRGEVFEEALRLKPVKKAIGMRAIRALGLYADAAWHASNELEVAAVRRTAARLGQHEPVVFAASDIAGADASLHDPPERETPRLVFFSRISRKKNLDFALRLLGEVSTPISLDIIGPREDPGYWRECEAIIASLPPRHQVRHLGEVEPRAVAATLSAYDLYLLPTISENFGHTIQEALAAGLPALISDQTPWRGLEADGAGWDLPLVEKRFADAVERFAAMPRAERIAMRAAARRLSTRFDAGQAIDDHRAMFDAALARR